MRKLGGVLGLGVALLLGWGPGAWAGDDDGDKPAAAPPPPANRDSAAAAWNGHLFGSKAPPRPRKPPEKDRTPSDRPPAKKEPAAKPAPGVDEAASVRSREEAALLRRMEVCLKLKQIAERTNDADLARLAEQLDQRANDIYFQRIANLPASHAAADLDEGLLEKHVAGPAPAAAPPAEPHTVPAPDSRRAAVREEEP